MLSFCMVMVQNLSPQAVMSRLCEGMSNGGRIKDTLLEQQLHFV